MKENTLSNPRAAACRLLQKIYAARGYANLALDAELSRARLSPEDKALCAALVYGVIERRRTLDYQLEHLLEQPLERLPAITLAALRMGLYQLFFMDKIPAHAAINESVELTKQSKAHYTAKLVNAVLRKAQGRGLMLPEGDGDYARSIRYACPEWLCSLWRKSYGDEVAKALLAATLDNARVVLRANTLRISAEELREQLGGERVQECPEAIALQKAGDVRRLQGFAEGLFHVQDTAAQLCCKALDPQPGELIFDLCAAPGGKSFTIAQMMQNQGKIIALDLHPHRLKLVTEGAKRLGITCIEAKAGDASDPRTLSRTLPQLGKADRILCDVPCSGLGIIRKKPDIREKMPQELDKLPEMQYAILSGGADCLRPGGTLVYATCTLNPAENEDVCARFLRNHPEFGMISQRTLLPHIDHTDGFYFAVFQHAGPALSSF